jgi:hypothetical protein
MRFVLLSTPAPVALYIIGASWFIALYRRRSLKIALPASRSRPRPASSWRRSPCATVRLVPSRDFSGLGILAPRLAATTPLQVDSQGIADCPTTGSVPKEDWGNFGKQTSTFAYCWYGHRREARLVEDPPKGPESGSYYRKKAEEMLKSADAAASSQARAEFLSLADHWHRLAQAMEKPSW